VLHVRRGTLILVDHVFSVIALVRLVVMDLQVLAFLVLVVIIWETVCAKLVYNGCQGAVLVRPITTVRFVILDIHFLQALAYVLMVTILLELPARLVLILALHVVDQQVLVLLVSKITY